ncbi:MAG: FAD:protein FMN transferase [Chloroflexi bacterium]|nr:FAD:protein FMN transferase [Chloroflexota bacterium]
MTLANLSPPTLNRRQFLQMTAAATAVSGVCLIGKRWPFGQRFTTFHETRTLMGTVINLAIIGDDAAIARSAITATFAEMERLIALFDHRQSGSPLARLNQSGHLAAPPTELLGIIQQARQYSDLTSGAFDISVKPLLDAYRAGLPAAGQRPLVDYRQIEASAGHIRLGLPGMALTLDGIAKGRVVDGATAVLQTHGFPNILVEAGGDLMGLGAHPDGTPWRVGISHPRATAGALLRVLPITMRAAATSGDYQHSFSQDFRQHHILDPRTGLSPTDLASVTVLAPSATDADALSTAVMVLGSDAGLALAARLPHVEALVVTKALEVRQTAGFPAAGDGKLESSK